MVLGDLAQDQLSELGVAHSNLSSKRVAKSRGHVKNRLLQIGRRLIERKQKGKRRGWAANSLEVTTGVPQPTCSAVSIREPPKPWRTPGALSICNKDAVSGPPGFLYLNRACAPKQGKCHVGDCSIRLHTPLRSQFVTLKLRLPGCTEADAAFRFFRGRLHKLADGLEEPGICCRGLLRATADARSPVHRVRGGPSVHMSCLPHEAVT
jgi:hypothetical protein